MILLTSFDTWLPSQRSNSSEDLLQALKHRWQTGESTPLQPWTILHRLPVETDRAFAEIMTAIDRHQAKWVVCCGMAESRTELDLEWQAKKGNQILRTGINLAALSENLSRVRLSEDAGNFVCNALYFELLNHLQLSQISPIPTIQALFVHIPPLLATEQITEILDQFEQILTRLN